MANQEPLDSANESPGRLQWRPDIYVHAFVPQAFVAINRSYASVINTPAIEGVDFKGYISTFAGSHFLSELEPLPFQTTSHGLSLNSLDHLRPSNYGQYFSDALALDMKARVPEIRSYDLFGVTLELTDQLQQVYSLRVPGLREGTPLVSVGDFVMLRQLVLDPVTGLPRAMNAWLAPGGGSERGEVAPGFTGYQMNAVVCGINKAKETLLTRVDGMVWFEKFVCNVSFVVQDRLIQGLQRAVADISQEIDPEDNSHAPLPEESKGRISHDLPFVPTDLEPGALYSRMQQRASPKGRAMAPVEASLKGLDLSGAMGASIWLQRVLFPEEANGIQQTALPSVLFPQTWFDTSLNYEQKKAVDAVQSKNYGDFCYLINGPPGTGKTKTLCEIVAQIGKDPGFPGSILLCAPSNPAADTLALRLRSLFDPKSMLRLNHFSRTFAEVPQELLPYCYVEHDLFSLPPMPQLMAFRVVVTTCQDADILVQARVTNRDLISLQNSLASAINIKSHQGETPPHWTALIVDEAAQATEPENLIPLSIVSPPADDLNQKPVFVMAGDQHQLNPRTYDRSTTLHTSFFERLSEMPVYASHPLARKSLQRTSHRLPMLRPPFVNLIRNYRSHPAILAIPSSMFYANTLIPEASQTDSLLPWTGWHGRRWPVLFVCNAGIDNCEDIRGVGRGWYNTREAQKAITYAQSLLGQRLIVEQSEICIMSPFQSQVNLLRKLARQSKLWGVNIGPMEAFQGLERRFVILCTTRARKRFVEEDKVRGIGIIDEKKKFNVAITRAKEGLVVLGNPCTLAIDPHWLAFLKFCWRNSLWQCDNDKNTSSPNYEETDVNAWTPGNQSEEISGLEAALVYKERDKRAGSKAARRFMGGGENTEDALWRSGLEAEEAVDDSTSPIGSETEDFLED